MRLGWDGYDATLEIVTLVALAAWLAVFTFGVFLIIVADYASAAGAFLALVWLDALHRWLRRKVDLSVAYHQAHLLTAK